MSGLVLGLTALVAFAQDVDPKAIVRRADDAVREVREFRYAARSQGPRLTPLAAVVCVRGARTSDPLSFRIDFSSDAERPTADPRRTLISNGSHMLSIDHTARSYELDAAPTRYLEITPSPDVELRVSMIEYVHPTPFEDELNSPLRYEGRKVIGGVECEVVFVEYSRDTQHARWYFGVADGLPRRVDRYFLPASQREAREEQVYTLELSDVTIAPSFERSVFQTAPPDRYRNLSPGRASATLPIGSPAPDVELRSPSGKPRSLREWQGRPLVIQFRASWCRHSQAAAEDFRALGERFEEREVRFVAVRIWDEVGSQRSDAGAPEAANAREYTAGEKTIRAMHVISVPTTYVLAPDGSVLYADDHYAPAQQQQIARLLDSMAPEGPAAARP